MPSHAIRGSATARPSRWNTTSPAIPATSDTALTDTGKSNEEWIKLWMDMTPMHRFGRPEEVAPLAAFLCTDAASYITGGLYLIDGGYTVL